MCHGRPRSCRGHPASVGALKTYKIPLPPLVQAEDFAGLEDGWLRRHEQVWPSKTALLLSGANDELLPVELVDTTTRDAGVLGVNRQRMLEHYQYDKGASPHAPLAHAAPCTWSRARRLPRCTHACMQQHCI